MRYIFGCLNALETEGHQTLDCRRYVHDEFSARLDTAHQEVMWLYRSLSNRYRFEARRELSV